MYNSLKLKIDYINLNNFLNVLIYFEQHGFICTHIQ